MTTVLIVDDDPVIARLMGDALMRDGFTIAVAHSLAEARQIAHPDLVIADVRLPNGDGRHLRADYPGIPFLTTSGAENMLPDLPKPFSMAALRAAVRELIVR